MAELLKLGHSCARKDFRDRALSPLMWEEIARHVNKYQVRFLLGCGSLYTTEPEQVSAVFALFADKYHAPEAFRVYPVQDCRFEGLMNAIRVGDPQALFQRF